ncbi:MAG TPA: DUF2147 domain-containing protein [Pseudolabrys sp.]|nr:DUF2147 domain-containing protein [Pseudolabrys sp.]
MPRSSHAPAAFLVMNKQEADLDIDMHSWRASIVVLCFLVSVAAAAPPEGNWLSEDGGAKVRISACGENRLCGTLVWLNHPIDGATGRPKTDKRNPDPAKRVRPLIGLQVVRGMRPTAPTKWSGLIYNADDGKTYRGYLTLQDAGKAKVEGCVLSVICKAHVWTRTN